MSGKLAGLLLLCAASFFIGLGGEAISRSQEGRVLETAREMRERGDYLVPYMLGQPRYEKPPLLYWFTAAGYALSGRVNELAGRVPVVLFGIGGVLLLYAMGCRQLGQRAGFFAGLALATGPLWVQFARLAETDVPQAFFVALALWAFLEQKPLLAWITIGVGCLNKGPAALVMPLVTLIVWRTWNGDGRVLLRDCRWWFVLVGLAIGLSWYLAVLWLRQESVNIFLVELGKLAVQAHERHRENLFYYFGEMLNFAPWSLVAFAAVPLAFWFQRRKPKAAQANNQSSLGFSPSPITDARTKVQTTLPQSATGLRFALTWFLATFIILLLTQNKQRHYMVVLLPPCALMAGWALDRFANWRTWIAPAVVAVCVLLAAGNVFKCAVIDPRRSEDVVLRDFIKTTMSQLQPGEEVVFLQSPAFGRNMIALAFYSGRIPETVIPAGLDQRLARDGPLAVITTAGPLPPPLRETLRAQVGSMTWTLWRRP